jgi:hypothetical protein
VTKGSGSSGGHAIAILLPRNFIQLEVMIPERMRKNFAKQQAKSAEYDEAMS